MILLKMSFCSCSKRLLQQLDRHIMIGLLALLTREQLSSASYTTLSMLKPLFNCLSSASWDGNESRIYFQSAFALHNVLIFKARL